MVRKAGGVEALPAMPAVLASPKEVTVPVSVRMRLAAGPYAASDETAQKLILV